MTLGELIAELQEIADSEDPDTDIYITIGALQTRAENVEFSPETDYKYAAVIIR